GFLTGKFTKTPTSISGQGRVVEVKDSGNPVLEKFAKHERNWVILDSVRSVAEQLGTTPAAVALAWVLQRPQVTSTLLGATNLGQLTSNIEAASQQLTDEALHRLNRISRPEENELDHFFSDFMFNWINGGVRVSRPI